MTGKVVSAIIDGVLSIVNQMGQRWIAMLEDVLE